MCAGGEQSVENLFVLQSFVLQQLYLNVRKKKSFTGCDSPFWFSFHPIKCKCSAAKVTCEDYEIEHHGMKWSLAGLLDR